MEQDKIEKVWERASLGELKNKLEPKDVEQQRLLDAAALGDVVLLRAALAAGAQPSPATSSHWHALHICASRGHAECVRALVEAGADMARATPSGWSPLALAAQAGRSQAVATLAGLGAPLEPRAMGLALEHGHAECARALSKVGMDVDWARAWGDVVAGGSPKKIRSASDPEDALGRLQACAAWLLGEAPSLDVFVTHGQPIVARLAREGAHPGFMKLALAAGAPVDAKDERGRCALHWAQTAKAARVLIQAGAGIDARDKEGRPPLLVMAAQAPFDAHGDEGGGYDAPDIWPICALLDAGANPDAVDDQGAGIRDILVLAQEENDRLRRWEGDCDDDDGDDEGPTDYLSQFEAALASPAAMAAAERRGLRALIEGAAPSGGSDAQRL